jgi:hypothetical protein
MENKGLKAFFSIIFIILIVYVISNRVKYNYADEKLLKGINAEKIKKINIKSKVEISLEKDGENWLINGKLKAQKEKIKLLLDSLVNCKITPPITENQSKSYIFDISSNSPNIEIADEKNKISFLVGKNSMDFNSCYIKYVDLNAIYEAQGFVNYFIWKDINEIADKKIFSDEKINYMKIVYGNKEIEFTKNGEQWEKRGLVTKNDINKTINSFLNLVADKVKQSNQKEYKYKITLETSSGFRYSVFANIEKAKAEFKGDYNYSYIVEKNNFSDFLNLLR